MIVATPLTILPENLGVPSPVTIITLCGIAASAFENAILKGASAGALSETGEKAKSFASIARTTGTAVGRGVGRGVGLVVGRGVGPGVEIEVGVALSTGLGVTGGFGVAVWAGLAVAAISALMFGVNPGPSDAIGDETNSLRTLLAGEAGGPTRGAPPHAATSRPMAIRFGSRGAGTAAL